MSYNSLKTGNQFVDAECLHSFKPLFTHIHVSAHTPHTKNSSSRLESSTVKITNYLLTALTNAYTISGYAYAIRVMHENLPTSDIELLHFRGPLERLRDLAYMLIQ